MGDNGRVDIPPEALAEYGFNDMDKLILLPGSRASGGFGLASQSTLFEFPPGAIAEIYPRLWSFQTSEGEVVEYREKPYCWVALNEGCILVPPGTLEQYGIKIGDKLLAIRGSGRALGFAVRGPIVEEAKRQRLRLVFSH